MHISHNGSHLSHDYIAFRKGIDDKLQRTDSKKLVIPIALIFDKAVSARISAFSAPKPRPFNLCFVYSEVSRSFS